jgi:exopolysaccharide biosynthesis polyprenyl glycosylphosphotransferase
MSKKTYQILYILFDLIAAAISWSCFYTFRKVTLEPIKYGFKVPLNYSPKFYLALALVPLFWIILYTATGTYKNVFRKSRLGELGQTLLISLIGVTVLFFALLLDDEIYSYKTYYYSFVALFLIHFFTTYFFRFIISTNIVHKIHNRKIGFNTLMVGSNENAWNLYEEMQSQKKSSGNKFVGFVTVENKNGKSHLLMQKLKHLGEFKELKKLITEHNVEEVIIAIESPEHEFIGRIINELDDTTCIIKVIPDMYDILSGSVKMTSIFGAALIEISRNIMPTWQFYLKRLMDIGVSLIALILLSPVYFIVSIIIKSTSKGPIFYSHERIGMHGKPFRIHKFRSMYTDAEKHGPALSSKSDSRITPFGKFMRKVRLDEIPQFWNVLTNDMSLVGPRPERQFFIDQIVLKAPHYKHLHKVRPGITSWGQVKYGYAENVDQMIERLKYDILYIENMSLAVDIKIMIYTVLIVVQGRGK